MGRHSQAPQQSQAGALRRTRSIQQITDEHAMLLTDQFESHPERAERPERATPAALAADRLTAPEQRVGTDQETVAPVDPAAVRRDHIRRRGAPAAQIPRPFYARLLRLHHIHPGQILCFLFFEAAIALGIVLGLSGLVSWWGVLALPLSIAFMVKLNDVVAGWLDRVGGS